MMNVACALDNADAALLPAVFKALETDLKVSPSSLGIFALVQSLCSSVAAPFWGHLTDALPRNILLSLGCLLWGIATLLVASSTGQISFAIFRGINGVALAVIGPLAQSVLSDLFVSSQRGRAFGWLGFATAVGFMTGGFFATSISHMTFVGIAGWRVAFGIVAIVCFLFAIMACLLAHDPPRGGSISAASKAPVGLRQIARCRTFWLLVLQGLFGNIPWSVFSFLTMWLQYVGFVDYQASVLSSIFRLGNAFGSLAGGILGDCAAVKSPGHGRVLVAQIALCLHFPLLFFLFRTIDPNPSQYWLYLSSLFILGFIAPWPGVWACVLGVAALRPILTDVVEPSLRGRIMAYLTLLEGTSGAVFGAPLVGYLSEAVFGYEVTTRMVAQMSPEERLTNVNALGNSILVMTVIPWLGCLMVWSLVYRTYAHDMHAVNASMTEAEESL